MKYVHVANAYTVFLLMNMTWMHWYLAFWTYLDNEIQICCKRIYWSYQRTFSFYI